MVVVDERGGSHGLQGAQKRLKDLRARGVDADLGLLPYGDYGIPGNGPNGSTVMVGVELKTTNDILSSLRSQRLMGHQIPGMVGADGHAGMFDRAWLLTEGAWRENDRGEFEAYRGSWQTFSFGSTPLQLSHLESWILSTVTLGGLMYWHATYPKDTARFIERLHHFWVDKTYEEHRAHEVIYRPPPDRASFHTPSDFVVMISGLPKIGWTRARAIAKAVNEDFEYLMRMSPRQLAEIEGIGTGIAHILYTKLHKGRAYICG